MAKFRKKPVVVEAWRWNGEWNPDKSKNPVCVCIEETTHVYHIHTLEGTMVLSRGDWIIKEVNGEFYSCKPDIFEATYEAV